jgi:hypothetical protein
LPERSTTTAGRLTLLPAADENRPPSPASQMVMARTSHPDAFHDVVFGLDAGWFDRSIDAAFPVGVLRTIDEWQSELTAAGLRQHHVVSVGGEQPFGLLAVAAAHASAAREHVNGASHDGPHKAAIQVAGTVTADIDALRKRLQVRLGFAPTWTNGHGGDDADGAAQDRVLLVNADAGLQEALEHLTAAVRTAAQAGTRLWVVCAQDTFVAAAVRAAARTASNEYADLAIRCVEIESGLRAEDAADRLADIVRRPPAEREIVIGASGVSVRRVRRGGRPHTGAEHAEPRRRGACLAKGDAGNSTR